MSYYQSTDREQEARNKLYRHVTELRAALLDLLTIVSASNDPVPATADIARSQIDHLKCRIRQIERQDHIIRRAREVIDGTKEAESLTGKQ